MRRIIIIFISAIFCGTVACERETVYSISGTWDGGDGQVVRLVDMWGENPQKVLDSAVVVDGRFRMEAPLVQSGKRVVLVLRNFRCPVFLNEEPVEFSVVPAPTNDTTKTWKVLGGKEQMLLTQAAELSGLRGLALAFGCDPVGPDEIFETFIDTNLNCQAIAYFMNDLVTSQYSLPAIERNYGRLSPAVQESFAGRMLKEQIDILKSVSIGGTAPDIRLADTSGQRIALYSLRGKYVLLDFWASWCGPCREEIPNLKEIYAAYHDKGLEIYSVSLDDKQEAWTKAIHELELPWLHVSSLKGWDCPVAKLYNVTGIPRMYLLDPQGKIIGMDLRGEALKETIASLLK